MIESRKNRWRRRPAFASLVALMILGAVTAPSKLAAEEPNQGAGDATPAPDKPSDGEYIGTENSRCLYCEMGCGDAHDTGRLASVLRAHPERTRPLRQGQMSALSRFRARRQ